MIIIKVKLTMNMKKLETRPWLFEGWIMLSTQPIAIQQVSLAQKNVFDKTDHTTG